MITLYCRHLLILTIQIWMGGSGKDLGGNGREETVNRIQCVKKYIFN